MKDALQRGHEMMCIKMSELPAQALAFARHLCQQVGMCAEVMLTAYVVYAQIVEGLACDDEMYAATPEYREWFLTHPTASKGGEEGKSSCNGGAHGA